MNKLIFQIGILAFFISAVIFGVQEFSLFDTLARAFIVFIAVVILGIMVMILVSYLHEKGDETKHAGTEENTAHSMANNE